MTGMAVVRARGGWAVRFGDGTRTESMTRRAAGERMAFVAAHRAEVAEAEAVRQASIAALLKRHGIGPVDFRQLRPGDLFTWRPEVPPKVVTEVRHLESGASLVIYQPGRLERACDCMILATPSLQAYGRLSGRDVVRMP